MRTVRVVMLIAMAVFVLDAAAAAAAQRDRAMVLHPTFRQVAGSGLLVGDRFVFIDGPTPSQVGTLIDNATGRARTVDTNGCRPTALGGVWLALTCGRPDTPTFELYNGQSGTTRPFTETVPYQECAVACLPIAAIGDHWAAFMAPSSDPHVFPTFEFQSLDSGQVRQDPTTSNTEVSLDRPSLTERVCAPLTVPPSSDVYSPGWGSLTADGRYTIASGGGAYLERCGTRLHRFLTYTTPGYWSGTSPGNCPALNCAPAHSATAIVWQLAAGRLGGMYLPSLRRFAIAVPARVDAHRGIANGDPYQLALTHTRLYLRTPEGHIWTTPAPRP